MLLLTTKGKRFITGGVLILLAASSVLVVDEELNSISGGFTRRLRRGLSLDLGGGKCEWTEPQRQNLEAFEFYTTLIAGFPSGDKRTVFVQMEALTGLPTKDDWEYSIHGYEPAPFIKTNYPHNDGTWSWDTGADQVALVVQNIRRTMVEYGYVKFYLSFKKNYDADRLVVEEMYGERNDMDDYYEWRDKHVLQEIYKWGWYIDYWMEGGLLRDPYNHNTLDLDSFKLYSEPGHIPNKDDEITVCHHTSSKNNPFIELQASAERLSDHLANGDYVGSCDDAMNDPAFVSSLTTPIHHSTHDPHCIGGDISGGCRPVAVISADRLRDYVEGPGETGIIGNMLKNSDERISKYVINEEAWPCIWDAIIIGNHGPKTFDHRNTTEDPNFSAFMLKEMLIEVKRLVDKYGTYPWTIDDNASRLVTLLSEYIISLETEYGMVTAGKRSLKKSDILGPNERWNLASQHEWVHN